MEVVDSNDVWVHQPPRLAAFGTQQFDEFRGFCELGVENFERDVLVQLFITCQPDFAHAAPTELSDQTEASTKG